MVLSSYSEVQGTKLRSLGLAAIKRIDFPPPKANIGKTKGPSCSESNANLNGSAVCLVCQVWVCTRALFMRLWAGVWMCTKKSVHVLAYALLA